MKTIMTAVALLATVLVVIPGQSLAQANDAKAILKAMSDYVGSLKRIQLAFDSDIEVITPQLEKIQFTNSGEAVMNRPDKLHARRVGGYADVEMFFDGKTVSIYGKHINGYAQFEAPGTVDQLIHALRAGHGIALPGADLLLSNSYAQAVVGRPASPVSYAGVARRSTVGAGAPGVGVAPGNRGGPVNRVGVR